MADDAPPPSTPLANLINNAKDGSLTVKFSPDMRVDAEEFAYIERDCQAFMDEIQDLQRIAQNISRRSHWGLGESTDRMSSANILVGRFRGKAMIVDSAKDTSNNVWDILDQHYKIVSDLKDLHHTIAQKFVEQDKEFASRYNELMANMPASPIGQHK